ncbi:MAG: carboxymuconolactone decarboxylase [Terrimonas sp.]|nr:carboxymuconolactone decarboxylase [Terrimonas sp.]
MRRIKKVGLIALIFCISFSSNSTNAQQMASGNKSLNEKEKSIIIISSLTAKGDLIKLKSGLEDGLKAGLTVNEIKEVLVHLYAYCGFPRSIRGLQTFMEVLRDRTGKNINYTTGKEASPLNPENNKYERGKKILGELTKIQLPNTLTGYSAFAPAIDTFLKEHLFADIFERDVLTYAQRELVTISVIATIGNADPMLQAHLGISLNVSITPDQLKEFVEIVKTTAGKKKSKAAMQVLKQVLKNRQLQ